MKSLEFVQLVQYIEDAKAACENFVVAIEDQASEIAVEGIEMSDEESKLIDSNLRLLAGMLTDAISVAEECDWQIGDVMHELQERGTTPINE